MQIKADSPEQYIEQLPEDRQAAMRKLRQTITDNLPEGFMETISYGMIGYVIPHTVYPGGYHVDPKKPLPYMSIASQKNYIALYHNGIYANKNLMEWFTREYARHNELKLDMGKSCIRFRKMDQIPFKLIGKLAGKMSSDEWIRIYELSLGR